MGESTLSLFEHTAYLLKQVTYDVIAAVLFTHLFAEIAEEDLVRVVPRTGATDTAGWTDNGANLLATKTGLTLTCFKYNLHHCAKQGTINIAVVPKIIFYRT